MKLLARVRVSPSGQSGTRPPPLGRARNRLGEIQRQPNSNEPLPADAGYSSYAQPVTGPAFPARAAMLFRLLSGSAAPRSERCRRSSPETTSRLRLPAGKPTAAPSPLPEPPCIPHLEPPAISIEQFRRMRHFFSIAEDKPWPIQDIFLVMFSLLSRLMSRIDPPVPQQLDPRGNLLPNSGRKLLAAPHLLDKAPVCIPVRTP